MKRVERPKIEQLSTGEQFHLVDMKLFEVIEGKNEPSSIRFEVPDTDKNKRVYPYVEDRNLLIFEGQYYIILVSQQDELGFKDCDAIQIGAELSLQTQEKKVSGYFSIEEALSHTFEGSNFKYINRCSKQIQLQFENFGGESRMKMIRKLLDRFDIECIFDNMTVIFADRIGKTTDKLYKFGYNVNAIKKTTDDRNCYFSVLLLGHTPSKEEGEGQQFTYYYESPLKYKMPELIRHRQADNIEDDKIKDNGTALERCKAAVNDIPIVSITVDHKEANFDDSNEPKVGDKAILQHHKYNMDFDVRVVKRTRYPYEQTPNNYEFSNKRDELVDRTEEQKKWTSDILSIVKDLDRQLLEQSNGYAERINKLTEEKAEEAKKESDAAKKLAELVKENQKNFQTNIIKSNTEPTQNLEPGKSLWLNTSEEPNMLYLWTGTEWSKIGVNAPEEIGAVTKVNFEETTNSIKQSVETVEKTQTAQGEQLKQAQSTLETQAEAIKAKVTITEVGNYVSSIGMSNLIRNSLLKTDSSHWSFAPNVSRDTFVTYNGSYTIKTDQIGLTADSWRGAISEKVPAVAGEDFVVSGWFMTDDKSKIDKGLRLEVEFFNASGTRIAASNVDFFPLENNVWKFVFGTFKAPVGTVFVDGRFYVIRNGRLWASKMMLQRGTKPSEFTENAADIAGKDELLSQIAEKVATVDYNKKIEQIDRDITANKDGITLAAKKTEVYTRVESDGKYAADSYVKAMEARISVTEQGILRTVKVGNVISSINQTAEAIQIEAKRINLIGAVTADCIAGKLFEGITIRARDPNDNNNFTEMSNGRIFTQGFQTPAQWNQWSKKVVTGLEKGLFYSRGYKEDGSQANYVEIAAWGASFNTGNDGATYGSQTFTILDKGQRKSITAKSYDESMGWKPTFTIDNPQSAELVKITSNAIYFYNMNKNYKNELVTEDGGSHLTLYKGMIACDDGWNGYLQVKNSSGSSHNGVVATEFKTTSQRKLKTYIKDLQFDALQSVLDLKIKEYYFKGDISTLYEMREQREEGQAPYTLNDIPKCYGFMVDDCPFSFTDAHRHGVNLYGSLSVTIKGFQQYVQKTDDRLNQIEKVIIDENNSKRRTLRKSCGRTTKRCYPREKHLFGSRNRVRSRKS
ncbi:prophage endopeptidase tail family protein [Bacillus sp. 71mf]|uniref:prophage endopeptidase tail family protein n=2 Tax=unclassified Bacillus (in: firmicutes) TaxID=185979 RepID=UPI0008E87AA6|nr:prophage endopeptidase tail family protein [Bacillus sp. 71mf]SFI02215.1 Prophage endopeptidase tail [Bacillus sp. 71mf]